MESFRDREAALRQRFSQEAFTDTCCCEPSGQRIKREFFIHSWEPLPPKVASLKSLQLYLRADCVNHMWCRINGISDQSVAGVPAYRNPALRHCSPYSYISTGRLWGVSLVKKVTGEKKKKSTTKFWNKLVTTVGNTGWNWNRGDNGMKQEWRSVKNWGHQTKKAKNNWGLKTTTSFCCCFPPS